MEQRTQVDIILGSIVGARVKDDRALMEFPFFSLTKQPRMEPLVYDDGKVRIEVQSGAKGMATIWDKDLLIYLVSIVNDRLERSLPVQREVAFKARDFLQITGRGLDGAAYRGFMACLDRLRSTTITTSITAGGRRVRGFGWIDNYDVIERELKGGKEVMAAVEITLNKWLFDAIVEDRRVLTINSAYFALTGGLERRLYELARKHCGQQDCWTISLPRLAEKCGSSRELRKFKAELVEISKRDGIPDYTLAFLLPPEATPQRPGNERVQAVFAPRRGL